ncbi:MAG: methyltransferase domain-containing protein [Gammaproteobacteria bacterium]|nr:methyltransferase domain-containing protein [Gammaproteobacteria bacterium]
MQIAKPTDITYREIDFIEQLLSLNDKTILDLGCGKADMTRLLASNGSGRNITATDVDEIQHAQNLLIDDLPNVTFLKAGSEAIPLAEDSFDFSFMFKSLHHVPMELMADALQEVKRILKPGGMAYISEPIFAGDFNEVLRLFHDEEKVRQAAFNAIEKCVADNELLLVDEIFFNTPVFFENFEDYERKVIQVTHSNHQLSPDVQQKVKQQFSLNMNNDGAEFLIPIRVNLLQKKPD